jgi:glutamine amidotransferase
MIAILDYDMGNVASIKNMLEYIGLDAIITNNYSTLNEASHLILPGVGSFDQGMKNLHSNNLVQFIRQTKKPLLGICLGMQLLGIDSQEGIEKGLNLLPFHNVKFKFADKNLKVPHMGWNNVQMNNDKNPLTLGMNQKERFYFVHSYYAKPSDDKISILMTNYGFDFTSGVNQNNIYGVQFHPEKSHHFGMKLLKNFGEIHA